MVDISTKFTRLLEQEDNQRLTSWLFLKALAIIYFAAFLSISVQITGLVGSGGILPIEGFLASAHQFYGDSVWWKLPTLFWLDHSDLSLKIACYAGLFFSFTLFTGRSPRLSLIVLFILYLSVFRAGQIFMSFQWDYLLMEAGFISIFLVNGPIRLVVFLFHLLLFRLRFLSGYSKLMSEDPSWSGLTALNHYFETQPLPHVGAWYAHQLPEWLLMTGTGFTLFVELIVPFFIFLPRPFRLFAATSTIFIQLMIIATSNHNWINLLTILLCLFLLDDRIINKVLPAAKKQQILSFPKKPASKLIFIPAALLISTSVATATSMLTNLPLYEPFKTIRSYGLGNIYHVFPTMQTQRHELKISGSLDGKNWKAYEFKYKPNKVSDTPAFIVPHQPRLDWMIWFIPPRNPEMRIWFDSFIWRLRENAPEVIALLKHNPFKDEVPRYIRVEVYDYHFTTPAEKAESGNFWRAEYLGDFQNTKARMP